MKHPIVAVLSLAMLSFCAQAQTIIPAKDALKHLGEKVTICDKVCNENLKASVIDLYLGGDRPNELLIVVCAVTGKNRSKHFIAPYKGKDVCVTGTITKDKDGKPVIKISDPAQIKPYMVDNPVKQKSSLN